MSADEEIMPLEGLCILVVEDEIDLRDVFADFLESHGAHVFSAQDGVEALDLLLKHNFHVVLSDIQMPHKDGISLFEEAKRSLPIVPKFMFMTGYTTYSEESVLALGAVQLLTKPFLFDKLLRTISSAVQDTKP